MYIKYHVPREKIVLAKVASLLLFNYSLSSCEIVPEFPEKSCPVSQGPTDTGEGLMHWLALYHTGYCSSLSVLIKSLKIN